MLKGQGGRALGVNLVLGVKWASKVNWEEYIRVSLVKKENMCEVGG